MIVARGGFPSVPAFFRTKQTNHMTVKEFKQLDFYGQIEILEEAVCIGSREEANFTALLYQHSNFHFEVYLHKKYRYIYHIDICEEANLGRYQEKSSVSPALLLNVTSMYRDFEQQCRQLIGETICGVEYIEAEYDTENPKPGYKTAFNRLDTVDFTVSLLTKAKKLVAISWNCVRFFYGGESFVHRLGISIQQDKVLPKGQQSWEVSNEPTWKDYVGRRIADVKVFWEKAQVGQQNAGERMDYHYPQGIALLFSNGGEVFISVAELLKEKYLKAARGIDNLLVTAESKLALQTRMLPLDNTIRVSSRRVMSGL